MRLDGELRPYAYESQWSCWLGRHVHFLQIAYSCKQITVQSQGLYSPPEVFYAGEGVYFVQGLSPVLLVGFASAGAAWVVPKRPLALKRVLVCGRCCSTFCNRQGASGFAVRLRDTIRRYMSILDLSDTACKPACVGVWCGARHLILCRHQYASSWRPQLRGWLVQQQSSRSDLAWMPACLEGNLATDCRALSSPRQQ